jgi:hypothetical protein
MQGIQPLNGYVVVGVCLKLQPEWHYLKAAVAKAVTRCCC